MAHILAMLCVTPPLDIYVLNEWGLFVCLFGWLFGCLVVRLFGWGCLVLRFTLEAISQDNVTAEGCKQWLLQLPSEASWLCERTSLHMLSWKSPLEEPGTLRCQTDALQVREETKMCELQSKTSKTNTSVMIASGPGFCGSMSGRLSQHS